MKIVTSTPKCSIRIGQLAGILGTTTKTIRFYERIGLLQPPARSGAGYRYYNDDAIAKARRVVGLRRLGFSIEEIKGLFGDDDGLSLRQRLLTLMDEKLRETEVTLGVLQGRRDDLAARHRALLSTPRDRTADCVCDALLSPCACCDGLNPGTAKERKAI